MESKRTSGLHRRDFIQVAAAGAALVGAGSAAAMADEPSETNSAISGQPAPAFGSDQTTADILVETLIAWVEQGKKPGKQKKNYRISFHDLKCSNILDGERSSIVKKTKKKKQELGTPG